jgi:hypothetical protein
VAVCKAPPDLGQPLPPGSVPSFQVTPNLESDLQTDTLEPAPGRSRAGRAARSASGGSARRPPVLVLDVELQRQPCTRRESVDVAKRAPVLGSHLPGAGEPWHGQRPRAGAGRPEPLRATAVRRRGGDCPPSPFQGAAADGRARGGMSSLRSHCFVTTASHSLPWLVEAKQ